MCPICEHYVLSQLHYNLDICGFKYQVSQIQLYQDSEALIFDCFHMCSVFLRAIAGDTKGTYNKLNNFCSSFHLLWLVVNKVLFPQNMSITLLSNFQDSMYLYNQSFVYIVYHDNKILRYQDYKVELLNVLILPNYP